MSTTAQPAKRYLYLNPATGRMVSRQRLWQLRKKADGRCIVCGRKRFNATHCKRHAWIAFGLSVKSWRKKKAKQ